ncbi:MAG: CpsB/CapC family capsule biosynthesis tyrosine phosphatase [Sphaerochaetaceae bacterium]|jgi:protein-tyrosine phosphatase
MGLVEVHAHVLPFVDDGVKSKEQASAVYEAYAQAGFSDIVTTVHLYNPYVHTRTEHIRPMFEWAFEEAQKQGVKLHLGSETYIGSVSDPQTIPFLGNCVLLETDYYTEPLYLPHLTYSLSKRGQTVILAHVERYQWLKISSDIAKTLKETGVLFQCNVSGVLGGQCNSYLEAGMVDILASDNHGDLELPQKLAQLLQRYPQIKQKMENVFRV